MFYTETKQIETLQYNYMFDVKKMFKLQHYIQTTAQMNSNLSGL